MLRRLRTILASPVFPEDEDKTRKSRYTNAIALTFIIIALGYELGIRVIRGYSGLDITDIIMIALVIVLTIGLMLLRKGFVRLTSILLVSLIWAATASIAASGFGIQDTSYIINLSIILMAGLLLGWQASVVVTVLSILLGFALAYAEESGLIGSVTYPTASFAQDMSFVFGLNAVLIYLLINGLENAIKRAETNSKELKIINTDLTRAQNDLQASTSELLSANQQLEKRTERLRTVAEVARIAASIQNFDRLLSSITHIISDHLGYYHIGVFLLDEQGQYAILRSANTEGGLRMLHRGYRLKVGEKNIVGYVSRRGQARIASVRGDDMFLAEADLPETRSEMALPLKSADQIIGVVDIRSIEVNAFSQDDIDTLSILADQIAIAIQNTILYEKSERALRDAEIASSQATGQAWKGYAETAQTKGYRYDGVRTESLSESLGSSNENGTLLHPVRLRGQTIGRLELKASNPLRQWTEDELAILEATAERVAIAIEGARLLEDAQKRATRESFLSDVAAKLGTSFKLDSILRDTVEELGQTLKGSTVSFQLVNPLARYATDVQKSNGNSESEMKSE